MKNLIKPCAIRQTGACSLGKSASELFMIIAKTWRMWIKSRDSFEDAVKMLELHLLQRRMTERRWKSRITSVNAFRFTSNWAEEQLSERGVPQLQINTGWLGIRALGWLYGETANKCPDARGAVWRRQHFCSCLFDSIVHCAEGSSARQTQQIHDELR